MDHMKCRSRANVVAIVDIVLLCFFTLSALFWLFAAGFNEIERIDINREKSQEFPFGMVIVVIIATIIGVTIGFQMRAEYKLLQASKPESKPEIALESVRNWKRVTTIFLIIIIISAVFSFGIGVIFLNVVWRGWGFYVVCKFVNVLEDLVSSQV